MQLAQEFLPFRVRVPVRVIIEIAIAVHVINIGPRRRPSVRMVRSKLPHNHFSLPDIVQRNAEFLKVVHNIFKIRPVIVTPAALVKAEGKVLLHRR